MESVIDKYCIGPTLGQGFSAKVKLAIDRTDNSNIAIKIFDLSNPNNDQYFLSLLHREFAATQKLNHKHIAKYYEFRESAVWCKKSGK